MTNQTDSLGLAGKTERDRKLKQDVFIRVCRDSQFQIEWTRAAKLTALILECHPMDVWGAFSCMDVMEKIAGGTHPAARRGAA